MIARRALGLAIALLGLCVAAPIAGAHTLSDGYVDLTVHGRDVTGRVDLAARDLHDLLGLDADHDGRLRWREIEAGAESIRAYVADHVGLRSAAGPCTVTAAGALGAIDRADGVHVAVAITARCPGPAVPLTLEYRAIFGIDARHTGLVHLRTAGGSVDAIIHGPRPVTLTPIARATTGGYLRAGLRGFAASPGHVGFLIALLLPALLAGGARHRLGGLGAGTVATPTRAIDAARQALVLAVAFTVAHSLALALAVYGWIHIPPALIATMIALSVAAAALDNVVRLFDTRWSLAVVFGLIHGLGLADRLAELGLHGGRARALVGFGLGVELGQAAVLAALLPIGFALRRTRLARIFLVVASLAMAIVALHGSYQRAFG